MTEELKPVRVQLSRKRGWRMPENTAKVDRSTRWGNPFVIGAKLCSGEGRQFQCVEITDAEQAVQAFRDLMGIAARNYPKDLSPLRGKNLACWCRLDQPCHADVLLELANRPDSAAQSLNQTERGEAA